MQIWVESQDSIPVTYLLPTVLLSGQVVRLPLGSLVLRVEREFMALPTKEEPEREGLYC